MPIGLRNLWCSEAMPMIPVLAVGPIPLLMWSVLPPLVSWLHTGR
jgi:hypothetical protein